MMRWLIILFLRVNAQDPIDYYEGGSIIVIMCTYFMWLVMQFDLINFHIVYDYCLIGVNFSSQNVDCQKFQRINDNSMQLLVQQYQWMWLIQVYNMIITSRCLICVSEHAHLTCLPSMYNNNNKPSFLLRNLILLHCKHTLMLIHTNIYVHECMLKMHMKTTKILCLISYQLSNFLDLKKMK